MKKGQARAYVRLQFAALRSFYKYLCQRKGLAINPLKALHLPKAEKKLPQPLTAAQIDELLAAPLKVEREAQAPVWMPARDAAVLELFYSSGLRLAELAALNCEDLDPYTESVRGARQGAQGAGLPGGRARVGSRIALPCGGGRARGSAVHLQAADADGGAFHLAPGEALPAAHEHPADAQSAQAAALVRHAPARRRGRTCGASRNCSATPASRPPRFTPR